MIRFNIMSCVDEFDTPPFPREIYFIDCPIDEFGYDESVGDIKPSERIKRIQIPRELANYIYGLQSKILTLELELKHKK